MTGQEMSPLGDNAFGTARLPGAVVYKLGLALLAGVGIWFIVSLLSPSTLIDTTDVPEDAATAAELTEIEIGVEEQSAPQQLNSAGTLVADVGETAGRIEAVEGDDPSTADPSTAEASTDTTTADGQPASSSTAPGADTST
ncbi:MAG: hypothetical protein WBM50_12810, partial [Acidimicrobiales bacterium]